MLRDETNQILIGGIVALMIAMGIGRFAYTPILPLMQNDLNFSETIAGLFASSNYAGYLVGAIGTSVFAFKTSRVRFLRIALFISIMTTIAMGLTEDYTIFHMLRFISGVASAYIFVLASSIVLDYLAAIHKPKLSGMLYAGVGIGILFSTIFIPTLYRLYHWQGTWIGLGIISALLLIIPMMTLRENIQVPNYRLSSKGSTLSVPSKKWFPLLTIAYGLEGFGYIITGTFIVAIAEQSATFTGNATTVWAIAGLSAIPSCMIWSSIANRFGYMKTLTIIFFLQAIGIILPALGEQPSLFYMSAILFGATFMGITTITATVARHMFPLNSSKIIGFLTVIYALGQMIGPAIGGWVADKSASYSLTLLFAGATVGIGAILIATGIRYDQRKGG